MILSDIGIDVEDYLRNTPLHLAAQRNHLKIVKYLVETCKADPNCINERGERPVDMTGDKEIKEV